MFGFINYEGGWSPGIRHLVAVLPFWIIGLAKAMQHFGSWKKPVQAIWYAALSMSLVFNILPKISHVFYPDIIPNPHMFSGLLWSWEQYIQPLHWGEWTQLIPIALFFALLATLILLLWKWHVRLKITLKAAASCIIGVAMSVGLMFLPLNFETDSESSFYGLSSQFVYTGNIYIPLNLGTYGRFQAEFPENQDIAGYYFEVARSKSLDPEWLQNAYEKSMHEHPEWFEKYGKYLSFWVEKLKKENEDVREIIPEPAFLDDVKEKATQYMNTLMDDGDIISTRRKAEYLYYAGRFLPEYINRMKYIRLYNRLKREQL